MLGAVQLGLLAACVVLFVPMAMAGWHLSRNKMLFFSCSLFITLAVFVHLMPYFPSLISPSPFQVTNFPVSSTSFYPDSCVSNLHNVVYNVKDCVFIDNVDVCDKKIESWDWVVRSGCEFQKLGKGDVSDLLNGSWVVVAGDSQARLMAVSLLGLVMGNERMEGIRGDLFKRHSDYSIEVDEIGMKLDFVWAPYVRNLTGLMLRLKRGKSYPDVMVMGAGLWDMLHVNNVSDYGIGLRVLRDSVLALLPVSSNLDISVSGGGVMSESTRSTRLLHLFWVGMPTLITSMLNTEEKRERMTDVVCDAYDDELSRSKLLRPNGGPLLKLDIRLLSKSCGVKCSADGMHYDEAVYDAALQIMLNALLIESNQKP